MGADTEKIDYWRSLAEYDLEVAASLLEKGHYLYVGFFCHQSVEKMLKACCVAAGVTPPMIHKLDKLLELAGLSADASEEQLDLLDELMPLNIQARYPAYKQAIHTLMRKEQAESILARCREIIAWLNQQIR
jgi:HEPN domain-containing protein